MKRRLDKTAKRELISSGVKYGRGRGNACLDAAVTGLDGKRLDEMAVSGGERWLIRSNSFISLLG
jgi:hypothetical protein